MHFYSNTLALSLVVGHNLRVQKLFAEWVLLVVVRSAVISVRHKRGIVPPAH